MDFSGLVLISWKADHQEKGFNDLTSGIVTLIFNKKSDISQFDFLGDFFATQSILKIHAFETLCAFAGISGYFMHLPTMPKQGSRLQRVALATCMVTNFKESRNRCKT